MFLKILRSFLFLFAVPFPCLKVICAQQPPTDLASRTQEIPFEYKDGYLISVRGSIGKHKNLQFLVDFGTTYTLVDRRFVDGPNGGQGLPVVHSASPTSAMEIVLPEFTIGPISLKNFRALPIDSGGMLAMPPHITGVIGLDVLQRHNMIIDFAKQKLFLSSRVAGKHEAPLQTCIAGLAVSADWSGHLIRLAISTGVDVITLDEERVKRGSYQPEKLKTGTTKSNFFVTTVAVFETNGMALNETGLRGPGILRHIQWPAASDNLDGFLPLTALGSSQVSLDFERHLLLWDDPAPLTQSVRTLSR